MSVTSLDLSGLKCPLPVLKTRKALSTMAVGEELRVTCTDPMSAIDIPVMLNENGDELLATEQTEAAITFQIRKR